MNIYFQNSYFLENPQNPLSIQNPKIQKSIKSENPKIHFSKTLHNSKSESRRRDDFEKWMQFLTWDSEKWMQSHDFKVPPDPEYWMKPLGATGLRNWQCSYVEFGRVPMLSLTQILRGSTLRILVSNLSFCFGSKSWCRKF